MDDEALFMCCEVCYVEFDDRNHQPALFKTCGHSVCHECLLGLMESSYHNTEHEFEKIVRCIKCKQNSKFTCQRFYNNKFKVLDYQNKILENSVRLIGISDPCNHSALGKMKYVCIDRACPLTRQSFCGYCRKINHYKCNPSLVFLKTDFEKIAVLSAGEGLTAGFREEFEKKIDEKVKEFGDWLKASFRAYDNAYTRANDSGEKLTLSNYLADPGKWHVTVAAEKVSKKLIFEQKVKKDSEPFRKLLNNAFLGDVWKVLPVAAHASFQSKIDAGINASKGKIERVRPDPVDKDIYTLIDDMATRKKGNFAKCKEIIEGHVPLFQNEFNIPAYKEQLTVLADKAGTPAKQAKELSNAHLDVIHLQKDCRFKLTSTNRELNNKLWPNNNLMITPTELKYRIDSNSKGQIAAELKARDPYFYLSKVDLEAIKKLSANWTSDQKHKLFAKIETLSEYLLTKADKKELKKLNAPSNTFTYTDFQKIEAKFVKHRAKRTGMNALLADLSTCAKIDNLEQVKSIIQQKCLVTVTYGEAKKVFSPAIISELKEATNANFGHRIEITELSTFIRKSLDEFERLSAIRAELVTARADFDKKKAAIRAAEEVSKKAKILLKSLEKHFPS